MLTCVQLDRIIHGRQQENKSQKRKHNKPARQHTRTWKEKKKKNGKTRHQLVYIIDLHRIYIGRPIGDQNTHATR
ncbi:Uncharacterized protein APZ42_012606 [Daphnia magna]|uniref:Uncharacterized protein n=1 Tax=Daphnia magna TaxID=35525 RepID=A0A162RNY9_9CRUS|nr:Uncharacterized protein APZ42_012606 [Daphnia magna]